MQDRWSDEEVLALADNAYKGRSLRCPRCGAAVASKELDVVGRASTPLDLRCTRCGASASYSPDHLEAMKLEWTSHEKIRIVERYWAGGPVECPNDGARLKAIESRILKPPPPDVSFRCPHCGRHFSSNSIEKVKDPDSFEGKYEVLDVLGEGGMGSVVLARHRESRDLVAAKKIQPKFLGSVESVRRFIRESRILEGLAHPNVVEIKETFVHDSGSVIVMQYIEGGCLTNAINGTYPHSMMLAWFSGIVKGLIYLHEKGVVHRDLKPDNILLDAETARISDFGLSRLLDRDTTTLTLQGGFLGTPLYAAPEQQANSANVGPRCDIYSLGLIAYEIATKRSPYTTPVNTTTLHTDLHNALRAALAPDAVDRPLDGSLLLQALTSHFEN